MMGRKQFSYPNLGNIKTLFILPIQYFISGRMKWE